MSKALEILERRAIRYKHTGYKVAEAEMREVIAEMERLSDKLDAAQQFIKRHPALSETDRAEFRAFLAFPAAA